MLNQDNLRICLLIPQSVEDFLLSLQLSKSSIKRFLPNKKKRCIVLKAKTEIEVPIDLINQGSININYQGNIFKIIFEDSYLIALHKPVNTHSVAQKYSDKNTSSNYLASIGRYDVLNVNKLEFNRGLLNRLDFETSGILIYSKDELFYERCRKNIHQYLIYKQYFALVEGKFYDHVRWHHQLGSAGNNSHKVVISDNGMDVYADYFLEKYSPEKNISLVKIILETGARHQIRVQLASEGFPIIGDQLYGKRESQRLYLHAYQYKVLLENKEIVITDDELEFDLFNLNN